MTLILGTQSEQDIHHQEQGQGQDQGQDQDFLIKTRSDEDRDKVQDGKLFVDREQRSEVEEHKNQGERDTGTRNCVLYKDVLHCMISLSTGSDQ